EADADRYEREQIEEKSDLESDDEEDIYESLVQRSEQLSIRKSSLDKLKSDIDLQTRNSKQSLLNQIYDKYGILRYCCKMNLNPTIRYFDYLNRDTVDYQVKESGPFLRSEKETPRQILT